MDRLDQIDTMRSDHLIKPSESNQICPECNERSFLRSLVAELLYKNQVLRLDLESAQEQLINALAPRIGDSGIR